MGSIWNNQTAPINPNVTYSPGVWTSDPTLATPATNTIYTTTMWDVEPVADGYGDFNEPVMLAAGGSRAALPPSPMRAVENLRIEQLNNQIRERDPNFRYDTIGTPGGSREGEVRYLEGVLRGMEGYPNKVGRTEEHHVTPQYLGGPRDGPTVPIPAPYHQLITNEFRNQYGYKQPYPAPDALREIMNNIYDLYPLPTTGGTGR